jgi:predicted nucleic acid-binding protein
MNRARLVDARAAVVDSTAGRKEKNRLSALSSRQKFLDETETLARRVLQLESQLQNCKNRLSRYEAVDDREEEAEEEELTEDEMGLQDCTSQTTDSAIVMVSSGGDCVGSTELEVNYADLLSDVDMSPFLEHQPEALLVY